MRDRRASRTASTDDHIPRRSHPQPRRRVWKPLYPTDRIDGGTFTAEDEELVLALAATAGVRSRMHDSTRSPVDDRSG